MIKLNKFNCFISLGISILVGFSFYFANYGEASVWFIVVGSSLSSFICLVGAIGTKSSKRTYLNVHVLSGFFLILFLIENCLWGYFGINVVWYSIVTVFMLVVYIFAVNGLINVIKHS